MKITLTTRQLYDLVKPVLGMVDSTDYLPVLAAVYLTRQGDHLIATATDRYRAGVKRVEIKDMPEGEFDALVHWADLSRLLALFKPGRRSIVNQPKLTLEVVDGVLYAEAVPSKERDESHVYSALRIGFPTVSGTYPNIFELIDKHLAREERPVSEIGFNPTFLTAFKVAAEVEYGGRGSYAVMRVSLGADDRKPAMIRIGENDDFIGLLMPRKEHDAGDKPAEWAPTLAALSKKAKAAARGTAA